MNLPAAAMPEPRPRERPRYSARSGPASTRVRTGVGGGDIAVAAQPGLVGDLRHEVGESLDQRGVLGKGCRRFESLVALAQ